MRKTLRRLKSAAATTRRLTTPAIEMQARQLSQALLAEPPAALPRDELRIARLEHFFSDRTYRPLRHAADPRLSTAKPSTRTSKSTRQKPAARKPSLLERIEAAAQDEGFEEAERLIQEEEARYWHRLSFLAQRANDPARATAYAKRAYDLSPRANFARRIARLSRSLGDLVLPERMWQAALDEHREESLVTDAEQLEHQRGWRRLYQEGFPIPVRAPSPTIDPAPGNVLYCLHQSLPHHTSGYATRSHGLLLGLRDVGASVTAVTRLGYPWDRKALFQSGSIPDLCDQDIVDGIVYSRLPTVDHGWGQIPPDQYLQAGADAFAQFARAERPSIIHTASNWQVALSAIAAARQLGLPSIYEVRGLWEITRASREPYWAESEEFQTFVRLETLAACEADAVIAITNALKDELVRRGVDASRITVVPNSVDPDRFRPVPRDLALAHDLDLADVPVVGYVGSFAPYEGLDDLVIALKMVRDRGVSLKLLLVGDGRQLPQLKGLVQELDLERDVILPGRVPFEDVQRYYSLIDIAAFPRKPRPVTEMVAPMKPFEAMAMEKAVLVSSVAALAENVTDGETGMIFEKGNIDSLADVLEHLAQDSMLCSRLGKRAREWVIANRTWRQAGCEIAAIYERLQPVR